jgi:cytochrome c oxidase subunit 2
MNRWLGFPLVASEHGAKIDDFIVFVHILMLLAFLGWGAWLAAALLRFRRIRHPRADYHGLRTRLPYLFVALMAVAEGLLLAGFALPFWHDEIVAAPDPALEAPFAVRVIGQQFQWNVHYPGPDGVFGRTDPALVDDVLNSLGLDMDDPAGEDDITTLNQLHLPLGRMAQIGLGSKDVIHSFFLPEFRVKQDAIPGMRVPVSFRPTMSTEEFRRRTDQPARDFEIACAQLCGINHYTMRGFVTVETQEAFDTWYAAQLEQKRKYAGDDWWVEEKPADKSAESTAQNP